MENYIIFHITLLAIGLLEALNSKKRDERHAEIRKIQTTMNMRVAEMKKIDEARKKAKNETYTDDNSAADVFNRPVG